MKVRLCLFKNSYVYRAGIRLLKYYEKRCKELGLTTHGEELLRPPDTKKPKFEENGLTVSEDEEAENIQKSR